MNRFATYAFLACYCLIDQSTPLALHSLLPACTSDLHSSSCNTQELCNGCMKCGMLVMLVCLVCSSIADGKLQQLTQPGGMDRLCASQGSSSSRCAFVFGLSVAVCFWLLFAVAHICSMNRPINSNT